MLPQIGPSSPVRQSSQIHTNKEKAMRRFARFFFSPDDGGGAGGTGGGTEVQNADQANDSSKEIEALKTRLADAEARAKKAEAEAKAAAKRQMGEDEKRKAEADELEKVKAETLNEYRSIHLQKAGLGEEYLPLVTGATKDEIAGNGELLKKLVDKIRSETEASVKKQMARTGAPGDGETSGEMDPVDYYKSLMGKK